MFEYPWNDTEEEEFVPPSRVAHPPPESCQENYLTPADLTWADLNELLNRMAENNYQCHIAQREVHQQIIYIMTLEDKVETTRRRLEETTQLLNQS